jgi:ABC-type sugar transport system permease subunit
MITVPTILKSPVTQFVVVLRFIDAMRAFEIPLSWSNWVGYQTAVGSPVDTLSLFLYKLLFQPAFGFPIGLVSAIALSLFSITLVGAAILLRLLRTIGG